MYPRFEKSTIADEDLPCYCQNTESDRRILQQEIALAVIFDETHQKSYINSYKVSSKRMYQFDAASIEDETGGYAALVPASPDCHTQRDTITT